MSSEDQNKKSKRESSNKNQEELMPNNTEWLLMPTEPLMKELQCTIMPCNNPPCIDMNHFQLEELLPEAPITTPQPGMKPTSREPHGDLKIMLSEPSQVIKTEESFMSTGPHMPQLLLPEKDTHHWDLLKRSQARNQLSSMKEHEINNFTQVSLIEYFGECNFLRQFIKL